MSQTRSQTWDHVCTVLLQSTGGSLIREALQLAGISSIPDLMQAKESDLDSLVYPNPNVSNDHGDGYLDIHVFLAECAKFHRNVLDATLPLDSNM
jgi:hypothetical protein